MLLGGCYIVLQIVGVALLFPASKKNKESEEVELLAESEMSM